MKLEIEDMAQFKQVMQGLRGMTFDIVSKCHDADLQKMVENVADIFNELEATALQYPLFPLTLFPPDEA